MSHGGSNLLGHKIVTVLVVVAALVTVERTRLVLKQHGEIVEPDTALAQCFSLGDQQRVSGRGIPTVIIVWSAKRLPFFLIRKDFGTLEVLVWLQEVEIPDFVSCARACHLCRSVDPQLDDLIA